jgi:hypothetical protein
MKQSRRTVPPITAQAPALSPAIVASVFGLVLIGLLASYMYFLSMSVVHVVLRKEVHKETRALESEIAALEAKYIEVQHQVSERIAAAEVLTETSEKVFVRRVPPTLVLSDIPRD